MSRKEDDRDDFALLELVNCVTDKAKPEKMSV